MGRAWVRAAAASAVASAAVAGCSSDGESGGPPGAHPGARGAVDEVEVVNEAPWFMHPVDGRFRGANGLGAADVNGDGRTDYVTNYEFDQRWVLALHPGEGADVRSSWPTVQIWAPDPLVEGNGKNPESTALGDFDGDGNIHAAGAHGFSDIRPRPSRPQRRSRLRPEPVTTF